MIIPEEVGYCSIIEIHNFINPANSELTALKAKADQQYLLKKYTSAIVTYQHTIDLGVILKDWESIVYCYTRIADCWEKNNDLSKKSDYLTQAVRYARKYLKPSSPLYALAIKNMGDTFISLQKIDSASIYLNEAYALYVKQRNAEQYAYCKIGLGVCSYYKKKFQLMEENLLLAKKIADKELTVSNEIFYVLFHLFSVLYQETGNFDRALDNAFDALNLRLKFPKADSVSLAECLNVIGILYDDKGDPENSINYYRKASAIYFSLDKKHINLIDLYNNIALYNYNRENFEEAITNFRKALSIARNHDAALVRNKIDLTYNFLSRCYLKLKSHDSASFFIKQALVIDEKYNLEYDMTLRNLGYYSVEIQDYDQALKYFKKSLSEVYKKYGRKHIKVFNLYNEIARMFFQKKEYSQTIAYCDSAINLNLITAKSQSIEAISKVTLLQTLHLKALTLENLSGGSNNTRQNSTLSIYKLAARLIDNMRVEYNAEGSKLHLAKIASPIYESAIEFCTSQYQKTRNPQFFEDALFFAEKNKAIVLLDAVRESNINNLSILPTKLVSLEKSLVLNKNFYTGKIIGEKKKDTPDSLKLSVWENKLFFLNKSYDSLIDVFESKYPHYYQLKYETMQFDLRTLRDQLLKDDHSAIVEYFVGEKNTYLFGVTKDQVFLKSIPQVGELQQHIKVFRNSLDFQSARNNPEQAYIQYTATAQSLYNILLKSFLQTQKGRMDKLIIIPSDIIGYIPFEALLKAPPASPDVDYSLKNLHYLIKDYTISYGYSAYFLSINSEQSKERKNLKMEPYAGFAPAFSNHSYMSMRSCDNELLSNLHCNKTEVEEVARILNGTSYTQEKSTKASFQKEASRYQILHLATHACLDNDNSLMNKIYFSDGFIPAYELSSHPLQAEMVVLSACNTGIGTLAKGEGFLSLSRSFAQAGCPSIVMSLWSVDDCSTSEVMKYFYENIKEGLPKDEALSKAKLAYLSGKDNLSTNPFFWAGFVHIGDISPISSNENKNLLLYVLSITGLLLMFFLVFVCNRKKKIFF